MMNIVSYLLFTLFQYVFTIACQLFDRKYVCGELICIFGMV